MRELQGSHPDVAVGSYPNWDTKELVIRVTGQDASRVEDALKIVRRQAEALGYKV